MCYNALEEKSKDGIPMRICAICNRKFEATDPAVLYVGKYGTPRVLCEHCEALLDAASASEGTEERREAREKLALLSTKMDDPEAMSVLRDVLDGKTSAEETEQDVLDEIAFKETIDEEEKEGKPSSSVWDYITLAIAAAAVIGFAIWLFF